ncbi:MAG: hypothetical protein U0166_04310 [Acidobacteriota bacterium]
MLAREGGRDPLRFWVLASIVYTCATIAGTWPVARDIGQALPGGGGDAFTHAWNLWYVHRALWSRASGFAFTDLLFHPIGTPLHYHVLDQGAAILAEPLQLASVSLPAIYSISWLLTFVLSGIGAAFFALRATGSRPGALVAGFLFMLCPYRTAHAVGHLELIGTQWMPLAAGLLLGALPPRGTAVDPSRRRASQALLAGLACAMAFLASFYFGVFLAFLLVLYVSWRAVEGPAGRRASLYAWLAIGAIPALPGALPVVRAAAAGERQYELETAASYPADVAGFMLPTYLNPLFGPLNRAVTGDRKVLSGLPVEGTVGLGFTALALAFGGWRRVERLWKAALVLFVVLSLGTRLHVLGRDAGIPLPYALLLHVPILRGARAPSRFVIMVSLCLVPFVAAGVARLVERGARVPLIVGALLAAGAAELAVAPFPMRSAAIPAPFLAMAADPIPGAVLTLPEIGSQEAMYYQTAHQRPLAGGWIARVEPALVEALMMRIRPVIAADMPVDAVRPGLAALGARYVVVEQEAMTRHRSTRPWSTLEARLTAGLGPPLFRDDAFTIYRVDPWRERGR